MLLGALGTVAAWLVLRRQNPFGPGLTPDSATYLSLAAMLLDGEGLTPIYDRNERYPPMFSLVVALGGLFVADLLRVASLVNALAFAATGVLIASWLRRREAPLWLAAGAVLASALCLPLANVAVHLWSESVFIALVLLSLSVLDRYVQQDGQRRRARLLYLAAAFAALCCLTRYMGVTVVLCGSVVLLFGDQAPLRVRAGRVLRYALIALVPVTGWLARNQILHGTAFGDGYPQRFSAVTSVDSGLMQILYVAVGPTAFEWLQSQQTKVLGATVGRPTWTTAALKAAVLLLGTGAAVVALALKRRSTAWRCFAVPSCFAFVYVVALVVAMPLRHLDAEGRYFAPLLAIVLLLQGLLINAFVGGMRPAGWRRRVISGAIGGGMVWWLALWVEPNRQDIARWIADGNDRYGNDHYGVRTWWRSQTVRYLKAAGLPETDVLTNDPFALYLLVGRKQEVKPFRRGRGKCPPNHACIGPLPDPLKGGSSTLGAGADGVASVVWFHRLRWVVGRANNLNALLTAHPALQPVAVLADGVVFRFDAPGGDAAARLRDILLGHARASRMVAKVDRSPSARSVSNVTWRLYLDASGRRLTYVGNDCASEDLMARAFLHVVPESSASLSPGRVFENLDFDLGRRGLLLDGMCLATAQLPNYPIAEVRTGQWRAGGELWRRRITLDEGAERDDER